MISISPGELVMNALKVRLSNVTTGLNPNLLTAFTALGIDSFEIDFTDGSPSFYQDRLDLASIQRSGYDSPQILSLWVSTEQENPNGQRLIFHTFSGVVQAGIDVILQYTDEGPPPMAPKEAHAVSRAILATVNTPNNQVDFQGTGYNGGISLERTPLIYGGENWVRGVRCLLSFEVNLQ